MNFFHKGISKFVVFFGIHHVVRLWKSKHEVTIILYHDPTPEIFHQHLSYLTKHYSIISLSQFLDYQTDLNRQLPHYPLVITFDDGHIGNFKLLDSIKKFKVTPTIYVCSGIVCTNRKFWFKLSGIDVQQLKNVNHDRRLEFLKKNKGFKPDLDFPENGREALSQDELNAMKEYVDFQTHTRFHPILTTCDQDSVMDELYGSREELFEKTGIPVLHIAYPNGDYSKREIEILRAAGFRSGRTTDVGWNNRTTDPFRLKITGVNDRAPLWMLKAELTGIPGYLYNIYKGGISIRTLRGYHLSARNL
jgi:peptidoglycan/xylan/chitin deacetylase (PgdA/CDA1 family)